jgi:CheY-like chemotaxis protein
MMPGMDGFEVLRNCGRSGHAVIIAPRPRDETDRSWVWNWGDHDYLPKPFSTRSCWPASRPWGGAIVRAAQPAARNRCRRR